MTLVGDIKDLIDVDGPIATVGLSAPSALDDAGAQLDTRWRNARRQLEQAGFPASELERMDDVVADLHHGDGPAVVLVQAPGEPTFVEFLDNAIDGELAVVDELAHVGPVLESRQQSVPHVMVVADRAGADLVGIGSTGEEVEVGIEGDRLHLHRGHPGGWSQRRFQQRAENRWESNAGEVADAVADLARRLDARLVTVAGDVRAVGFLLEQLPTDVADISRKLDGQSLDLIAEETVRAVADVVARDTRALLERFNEASGRGHAASGPSATLEALSAGRAEVLLVHDDPSDDRRARFQRSGVWCAPSDADSSAPGPSDEILEGRLIDVAIRAALLGDAEVRFVPEHSRPEANIGALLRW
jgi:peptide subunit release factor 1 (eRF1)